jgi:hypothetical protein
VSSSLSHVNQVRSNQIRLRVPKVANVINLVMILVSLALVALVLSDYKGVIRQWLSVAVFVLGPGSGLVQFLRLPDGAMQVGVLIGISAAIDLLLAQGLLGIHNISGDAAACLLAGITCIRPLKLNAGASALNNGSGK